jgi:hypothetical protein
MLIWGTAPKSTAQKSGVGLLSSNLALALPMAATRTTATASPASAGTNHSMTPTPTTARHVDYDSFGQVTGTQTLNSSVVDQLFYFQGQERDANTGLQKHGAR